MKRKSAAGSFRKALSLRRLLVSSMVISNVASLKRRSLPIRIFTTSVMVPNQWRQSKRLVNTDRRVKPMSYRAATSSISSSVSSIPFCGFNSPQQCLSSTNTYRCCPAKEEVTFIFLAKSCQYGTTGIIVCVLADL